jgi:uncharacterized protein with ParB-like and HNH nuclease domain
MPGEKEAEGVNLIRAVQSRIEKVRTRSLDLSFNELLDMHQSNEMIIRPEYQRLFRWSEAKQSRFIESLLLELPVPPIFVIELEESVYELIDGLQRISSYLHFRGAHPERRNEDGSFASLRLSDCDIVEELNNLTYADLPPALQIKLKRNFVRVEVIRKESDRRLRYYMFKRLNTGGENLSEQEVRNCTIRLLDTTFNDFIIALSEDPDFRTCIQFLSPERVEKMGAQELVLRFFAFKNYRDHYVHEVGDFMTEYMEAVSDPERPEIEFAYDEEQTRFRKTFRILARTLGPKSFSRPGPKGELSEKFLSYHYEAFTLAMQKYLEHLDPDSDDQMRRLHDALLQVKTDPVFIGLTTGGGKNYPRHLEERIKYVADRIEGIV